MASAEERHRPTVHLDFGELIAPDLEAELRRIETRLRPQLVQVEEFLGWPLGAFRPATANLVAGIIFGVVFILLGCAVFGFGIFQAAAVHFQMPMFE